MLETTGSTSLLPEATYNLIYLLHVAAFESTPEYTRMELKVSEFYNIVRGLN